MLHRHLFQWVLLRDRAARMPGRVYPEHVVLWGQRVCGRSLPEWGMCAQHPDLSPHPDTDIGAAYEHNGADQHHGAKRHADQDGGSELDADSQPHEHHHIDADYRAELHQHADRYGDEGSADDYRAGEHRGWDV